MKTNKFHNYIQITRRCNQECVFCSNPYIDQDLTLEEFKKLIDELKTLGCKDVFLTGGEPTLNKELFDMIRYCKDININVKMITNAQLLSNEDFYKKIIDSGISTIHISTYSHKKEIHDKITRKKDSYDNLIKALKNITKISNTTNNIIGHKKVNVNLNIVISSFNYNELSQTIDFYIKNFPTINHYCLNYIDVNSGRAKDKTEFAPRYILIEHELNKSLHLLKNNNKTFRIERIPLCYLTEFEDLNTECRKIVKKEQHVIKYTNKNNITYHNKPPEYHKNQSCKICKLKRICPGIYNKEILDRNENYPVFIDPLKIISKILKNKIQFNFIPYDKAQSYYLKNKKIDPNTNIQEKNMNADLLKITEYLRKILRPNKIISFKDLKDNTINDKFNIFIGGEHKLSKDIINNIKDIQKIIIIDAHLDLFPDKNDLGRATWMNKLDPKNIIHIGGHLTEHYKKTSNKLITQGTKFFPIKDGKIHYYNKNQELENFDENRFQELIKDKNVYLSIDIDAFNNTFGLYKKQEKCLEPEFISKLHLYKTNIIGADIMEISSKKGINKIKQIIQETILSRCY